MDKIQDLLLQYASEYLPKIIGAILLLVLGFALIKRAVKVLGDNLEKTNLDRELASFFLSFASISLKIILLFVAAGMVGIDTASIIAVMAGAGFAVGLALQGSLGNFAAGILILIFKPYKVGDFVEIKDKFGKVQDIQIFSTILETPGKKTLIIPNGEVNNGIVTNYSTKGVIRLELEVHMTYKQDVETFKQLVLKTVNSTDKVLATPAPEVGIEKFDSHYIQFSVKPYVLPEDYWTARYNFYENIKNAFASHNIEMVYPEGFDFGKYH